MQHVVRAAKYVGLPFMVAVYPAVFHYANNAGLVLLSSMLQLAAFLAAVGLAVYILFVLLTHGRYPQSAVGAALMLGCFHTYGLAFDGLRSLDILQVETYNFLPFYIFVAVYMGWCVTRLERGRITEIWNLGAVLFGVLVVFNVVKSIPAEVEKSRSRAIATSPIEVDNPSSDKHYPDIYYFILDEAAGFDVARRYWNYKGVDEFVSFLETKGFFVAERSHSGSVMTMREIAARLNYKEYPINYENREIYSEPIANNKVMQNLKSLGYTTVVYQEPQYVLPAAFPLLPGDHVFSEPPEAMDSSVGIMDDYKRLVLDNTVLRPLIVGITPHLELHINFIKFAVSNVASTDFPSPRFVYVHLLLPHAPFVFDANGGFVKQTLHYNWRAYLGNYKYSLKIAQQMIRNILVAADPAQPPVIILQSDHGVRNHQNKPFSGSMDNFPEEYKTWIINAMFLPGCEDAPLSQDMDPINTFPIVFNCYFDANIPLK